MSHSAQAASLPGEPPQLMSETARNFFALLLLVTLIPYVWVPVSWAIAPLAADRSIFTLALVWIGSQAHVAASFYFYSDAETRPFMLRERPSRFVVGVLAVIIGFPLATSLAGRLGEGELRDAVSLLLIGGYWSWQAHHYSRQNYGILSFLGRAEGASVRPAEARALQLTSAAGIIGIVQMMNSPSLVFLGASPWVLSAGLMAAGWGVWLLDVWRQGSTGSSTRTVAVVVGLAFYLPLYLFDDVFPAIMGFALAHGLQYFVFMGCVTAPAKFGWRPLVTMLLITGAVGWPLLQSTENQFFTLGLGVVMAHFVLDAGMWKLSEPFQRGYMAKRFPFLTILCLSGAVLSAALPLAV
ncbi:MAG: hypothetical protein ABGY42_15755 [bacterium]